MCCYSEHSWFLNRGCYLQHIFTFRQTSSIIFNVYSSFLLAPHRLEILEFYQKQCCYSLHSSQSLFIFLFIFLRLLLSAQKDFWWLLCSTHVFVLEVVIFDIFQEKSSDHTGCYSRHSCFWKHFFLCLIARALLFCCYLKHILSKALLSAAQ